jgi:hypothetical protein
LVLVTRIGPAPILVSLPTPVIGSPITKIEPLVAVLLKLRSPSRRTAELAALLLMLTLPDVVLAAPKTRVPPLPAAATKLFSMLPKPPPTATNVAAPFSALPIVTKLPGEGAKMSPRVNVTAPLAMVVLPPNAPWLVNAIWPAAGLLLTFSIVMLPLPVILPFI